MTFTVAQHDTDYIARGVTALTDAPVEVLGETYLTWMATLTPVKSAGIEFHVHADGFIEHMVIPCPSCGVQKQGGRGTSSDEQAVARGKKVTTLPVENRFRRLLKRATNSCPCDGLLSRD